MAHYTPYFQSQSDIANDRSEATKLLQSMTPVSAQHLIDKWLDHMVSSYVGNPTFTGPELLHSFLFDVSELGDPAFDPDSTLNYDANRLIYESAVALLARVTSIYRKSDIKTIPEIANKTTYEYCQDTIDFDQLCEDVANEMDKLN